MILELLALLITPVGAYRALRSLGLDRTSSVLASAFWTTSFYALMKYVLVLLGALVVIAPALLLALTLRRRSWRRPSY